MHELRDRIEAYAEALHEECEIVLIVVVSKEGKNGHFALTSRGNIFEASGLARAASYELGKAIFDAMENDQ